MKTRQTDGQSSLNQFRKSIDIIDRVSLSSVSGCCGHPPKLHIYSSTTSDVGYWYTKSKHNNNNETYEQMRVKNNGHIENVSKRWGDTQSRASRSEEQRTKQNESMRLRIAQLRADETENHKNKHFSVNEVKIEKLIK